MTISDPQGSQPLTRRQLRELRETGATPIVVPPTDTESEQRGTDTAERPVPETDQSVTAPQADADDAPALLTRRQLRERAARESEKDQDDAPESSPETDAAPERIGWLRRRREPAAAAEADDEAEATDEVEDESPEPAAAEISENEPVVELVAPPAEEAESALEEGETAEDDVAASGPEAEHEVADEEPGDEEPEDDESSLHPELGQALTADPRPRAIVPPSFDELIASTDTSGTRQITPSALIFPSSNDAPPLSGPMEHGGDLLITSSYEFPKSVGSHGHAPGTTDGKEADAVLLDGELSAASSPAPVAASSAISTIKPAGEVLRQPAPEKGGKAVLVLSIIAGIIGVVLSGVLILAFVNGVF